VTKDYVVASKVTLETKVC